MEDKKMEFVELKKRYNRLQEKLTFYLSFVLTSIVTIKEKNTMIKHLQKKIQKITEIVDSQINTHGIYAESNMKIIKKVLEAK